MKKIFPLFLFLAFAFAVYAASIPGKFVWDDGLLISGNPFIKSPIFAGEAFTRYLFHQKESAFYRPIQTLTYQVDYFFWGLNPIGYHITNILIHALAGFFFYLLLRQLFSRFLKPPDGKKYNVTLALILALAWTIHPIHNAAVAYIAGRADSLAMLFGLLAWYSYYQAEHRRIWGIAALFFLLCAICSKEMGLMWACVFLFYLFFFEGNSLRKKAGISLAVLGVVAIYTCLRQLPRGSAMAEGEISQVIPVPKGILMFRALGDYLGLFLMPLDLRMERQVFGFWEKEYFFGSIEYFTLFVVGVFFLAGLGAAFFIKGENIRLRRFGVLWFLVTFLPISNLFNLNATVAEHWMYMPSLGFLIMLAPVIHKGLCRRPAIVWTVVILCFSFWGVRTAWRCLDWRDSKTFYGQILKDGGPNPRTLYNLAVVRLGESDLEGARKLIEEARRRSPDVNKLKILEGRLLLMEKKYDQAEALFRGIDNNWIAKKNVIDLLVKKGELQQAQEMSEQLLLKYPGVWSLYAIHARILFDLGNQDGAIRLIADYVQKNWWDYEAHVTLAKYLIVMGRNEKALPILEMAAPLDVKKAEPYVMMATVKYDQKNYEEARYFMEKAISREPHREKHRLDLEKIQAKLKH